MSTPVNVQDVEELKRLRAQIIKFAESISSAVADAAADGSRTLMWLELEQNQKWKMELRKRHDKYQQALDALRQKQLYKGPSGERQSYVDEQVAANRCRAARDEAESKLKAIASHKNRLSREMVLFQGALARISIIASHTAPAAAVELGNLITALDRYAKTGLEEVTSAADSLAVSAIGEARAGMARHSETTPLPEEIKVDWDSVLRRATEAFGRLGGEVVCEPGVGDFGGLLVIYRDGFSGRIFAGPVSSEALEPGAKPVLTYMSRADLGALLPGLGALLEVSGERRGVFEGGEMLWHN